MKAARWHKARDLRIETVAEPEAGQYGKDGFGIVKIESYYGEATRAGDSSTTGRNFVIDASHTHTVNLSFNSQNKSFKTISPFLVVYIWKRKA